MRNDGIRTALLAMPNERRFQIGQAVEDSVVWNRRRVFRPLGATAGILAFSPQDGARIDNNPAAVTAAFPPGETPGRRPGKFKNREHSEAFPGHIDPQGRLQRPSVVLVPHFIFPFVIAINLYNLSGYNESIMPSKWYARRLPGRFPDRFKTNIALKFNELC
jgi:hypothetical protein